MKPRRRADAEVLLVLSLGPRLPEVRFLGFRSRHLLRGCGGFLVRKIKRLEVSGLRVSRGFALLHCQRRRWKLEEFIFHPLSTVTVKVLLVSDARNQSGVSQTESKSMTWISITSSC